MTGFEPRTFGIGSDRSTNLATTTAQNDENSYLRQKDPKGVNKVRIQVKLDKV